MRKLAFLAPLVLAIALPGCSIRQSAFNAVANAMAPYPSGRPASAAKAGTANPMLALTGESDVELMADFFPTTLKIYEMMLFQNPGHEGLGLMTGQLYVTYANAFVQGPADALPPERFDEQNAEYERAQKLYTRGADYVLGALDHRHRNFRAVVRGKDEAAISAMLSRCSKADVAALYWAGSGTLGAFSLSPLDANLLATLPGAIAMLERAAALDPSFNRGAIWEVLMAFYASAPESLGGGRDKALVALEKAREYSEGKSPSVHVAYARLFCVPAQDGAGFDEAIENALAIDPESQPENRLALTLAHRQAQWLKEHKADYILE